MNKQLNNSASGSGYYTHIFENTIAQKSFALVMLNHVRCEKIYILNSLARLSFSTEELKQYTTIEFVELGRHVDLSSKHDIKYIDTIPSTIRYGFSLSRDLEEADNSKQTLYSLESLDVNATDNKSVCINVMSIRVALYVNGIKQNLGWKQIDANEEIIDEEEN